MARTTVEDCIKHCENHFELVLGVVSRAKKLHKGEISELHRESDKVIIQSLREISQGKHVVDLHAEIERSLAESEQLTFGPHDLPTEADNAKQPESDT